MFTIKDDQITGYKSNRMFSKKILVFFILLSACLHLSAQDVNLDSLLDAEMNKKIKSETQLTEATFKTSRLINGHTVETTQKGILDFKLSHRFGTLNEGFYELFGLDQASMRIGLDYGITNRLTIGAGRSTFEKQYDGFLKYRLLWQSTGKSNVPVSVTLLSSMIVKTIKESYDSVKLRTSDRYYFAYQALIARKFSSNFSLQVMPTLVHYNLVPTSDVPNDLLSIGIAGRIKLTKRTSLTAEYYYQLPGHKLPDTYNSFSLGYEIETGGHVFQLNLTNSTGMTERTFINETKGQWKNGDIHFGFNISRVFTVQKPKPLPGETYNPEWSKPETAGIATDSAKKHYAIATFRSIRLINGHTVETMPGGVLNVNISHRFGPVNSGLYEFFGLDNASVRLGMDYGLTNRLTIGGGRSSYDKEYDGYLKYKLLWQQTGERKMPVSLSLFSSAMLQTIKQQSTDTVKRQSSDRYTFAFQAILARKFNNTISMQLMPTMVHYNIVPSSDIPNDLYSIGGGLKLKLTKMSSLTFEYYYQLPGRKLPDTYNSFSIGYEIETGGHVFQLHLTNSTGMTERMYITNTTNQWEDGGIHLGFNISRVFTIRKPKDTSNL